MTAPAALAGLLWLAVAAAAQAAPAVAIDPAHTELGFEVRTRYGQRLSGHFPVFRGQLLALADGRRQVQLTIDARHAEVRGHPRYTRWLRSAEFFDVQRHADIVFRSDPIPPGLGATGGRLGGELVLRGVHGVLALDVVPAACTRPGYDCPLSGRGTVSRAAFGMDGWQLAVSDRVTFVLHVRLTGADS